MPAGSFQQGVWSFLAGCVPEHTCMVVVFLESHSQRDIEVGSVN